MEIFKIYHLIFLKVLPLLILTSCGFFKNSLHMENSSSSASASGAKLASLSMSVTESSKRSGSKTASTKSLGLVATANPSGLNLASQTGALAADQFTASLTGCASGLSGTITGSTFNAYLGDSGCIVKLRSLTIHNRTYTSTASGAQDFSSWNAGQTAKFAEALTGNTVEVLVVSQLSSNGVQNSDYVSYVFTILTHNSDVIVSSSHQLLVAGQDAPNFEILNTSLDFANNTLSFQVKCSSGLLISDGSQYTFCPTYNGANYASGAGVDIAGTNNADASSLFNYALIPYDSNLTLSSARTAVSAAALASQTQLATVQSSSDLLSFSNNNDNYGFQTISLHSPDSLTSTSPYQVILILQAKNTSSPTDINKSSFQYFTITVNSNVNSGCSASPGLCLVTISGGNAIAQTSGGVVTNTLPDSGATNVSVNSRFSLFFTTQTAPSAFTVMNSGNTNSGNLTMSCNSVTQTGTVVAGDDNQTVILNMDSALPPLTSCTLTVGSYNDAVGHSNISGHVYSFTTGCITNDNLTGAIDTSSCYSPIWTAPEYASTAHAPSLVSSFQNSAYKLDISAPTDQLAFPIAAYYKQFSTTADFTATITLKSFSGVNGGNSSNQLGGDICGFEALTSSGQTAGLALMSSTVYSDPATVGSQGYLSIRSFLSGSQASTSAASNSLGASDSTSIYSNYDSNPIKLQIQKVGGIFTTKYSNDGGASYTTAQTQTIPNFGPTFYLSFGGSKYTSSGTLSCSFSDLTISNDTNSTALAATAPQMGGQDGVSSGSAFAGFNTVTVTSNLSSSFIQPRANPTPSIHISGASPGATLTLYTDSACTNSSGSALVTSSEFDILSNNLPASGTYTFYVKQAYSSQESSCSSSFATYYYRSLSPIDCGANWTGTKHSGVAGAYSEGYPIAIDSLCNVYLGGYTNGDLDGSSATGTESFFIIKYNINGVKQWTRQLGQTTGNTEGIGITTDTENNVYITGWTQGNLDGKSPIGDVDTFVAKYDTLGNKQWTKLIGHVGEDNRPSAIVSDASDNVYVASAGGAWPTSTASLTKLDSDGNVIWSKTSIGQDSYTGSLTIDSSSNLYFLLQTDMDFVSDSHGTKTMLGDFDSYVVKYNSSGVEQLVIHMGKANLITEAYAVTVDNQNGDIYVSGGVNGALGTETYTNTHNENFVIKYNSSGSPLWEDQYGASNGWYTYGYGICNDGAGNIYIGGYTSGDLPGNTGIGSTDMFVTKYLADGTRTWITQKGLVDQSIYTYGIACDNQGNVFVGGYISNENAATPTNYDGAFLEGDEDTFVAKFNSSGVLQ